MKRFISCETIRYFETDRMKVAHHSHYLVWFEAARTGLMAEAGCSYKDLEEKGYFFPVIAYGCRIEDSAGYMDKIEVETWIEELKSRMVLFKYKVWKDAKCIATGWTKHICVGEKNKYRRIPSAVLSSLGKYTIQASSRSNESIIMRQ